MVNLKRKNYIISGIIAAIGLLIGLLILLLLLARKGPDPRALLAKAESRSEQNLCLMAILQKGPDEAAARQLLENYQALGADPLTIYAIAQKYGLQAQENIALQSEEPGAILTIGGIAGKKVYKDAHTVADAGNGMVYYATSDGIYADYLGLTVKISSISPKQLTATERGIYFINTDQKKLQYLARDGHKIQTISAMDAQSFAFFGGKLWIADTEGALYCDGAKIETEGTVRSLFPTEQWLYAAIDSGGRSAGILAFDLQGNAQTVLTSPAFSLWGGKDGCLYFLNDHSYPMRYDPKTKEAKILAQKKALALEEKEGIVYYLTEHGKIKKIA